MLLYAKLFANVTIGALIEAWIEGIEVFAVQFILGDSKGLAEALEVHQLSLAQEFDGFTHIRLFDEAQDVVVGGTGLLLCCNHIRTTCDYQVHGLKKSSEFQLERPLSPEYACQRIYNQPAFPRFHG